jgi:hypothetical protein
VLGRINLFLQLYVLDFSTSSGIFSGGELLGRHFESDEDTVIFRIE